MSDERPKSYSEIQDRNLTRNPELRDQAADNSTFTPAASTEHLEEPSACRTANSIEAITPSSDNCRAGGMMGEG